jgi:hypothetical protein
LQSANTRLMVAQSTWMLASLDSICSSFTAAPKCVNVCKCV